MTEPAEFTEDQQAKFLAYIEDNPGCSIKDAATDAGTKRFQAKALMAADPEFRAAYDAARGIRRDRIRDEVWARAFDRTDQSSGRLLLKLAEWELPEARAKLQVSGDPDAPVGMRIDLGKLSAEQLGTLKAIVEATAANAAG